MEDPWVRERIYAPYKIAAMIDVLTELGHAPEPFLAGTGIRLGEVHDPETRSSVEQYLLVCRNALRIAAKPELPFLVGERLHLSAYGMYGYALLCCLTVRDILDTTVKYHRLATPTLTIRWREEPGSLIWTFSVPEFTSLHEDLTHFLLEQQLTQHITHLADLVGTSHELQKVCLPYPAPVHAKLYHDHFQCPVMFAQPECELHLDVAVLDMKPQLANRLTADMLKATCDRLIGESKTALQTSGKVYKVIAKTPGRFPGMEEVAKLLNMTSRTLRRRLKDEGYSFSQISDDVRQSFAMEYLRTTDMTTEDIAPLVGFGDGANFRHAFKKWTGKTVGEFRRAERGSRADKDEARNSLN